MIQPPKNPSLSAGISPSTSDAEPLLPEEITGIFGNGGFLAKKLQGYEQRGEQLEMALDVAAAFNNSMVSVIEAGTGTGKSLAYLIPAALWAVRNNQKVVISTNTINLQEQLVKKDIPFLQRHSAAEFTACLVKGRGNYLCLRKLEAANIEPALFPDSASHELQAMISWRESTRTGCLSDITFQPSRELWDELRCEPDQCLRSKCPEYSACFFYKARRDAGSADILVANHALLLADIALRRESGYDSPAILPQFSRLVIDEAHHLEEAATGALSAKVSRNGLILQLARLVPSGSRAGILSIINSQVTRLLPDEYEGLYQELSAVIESALLPQTQELSSVIDREFDWLGHVLTNELMEGDDQRSGEIKRRIKDKTRETPFWHDLNIRIDQLVEKLLELAAGLGALDRAAAKLPENVRQAVDGYLTDAFGIGMRLGAAAKELRWFCANDDDSCRWLESRRTTRGLHTSICVSPLDVAETIKVSLLDPIPTVILTSATLTVGGSFSYMRRRNGLDLLEAERLQELALHSPFDYSSQALIAVPTDLPDPTSNGFQSPFSEAVLRAVTISDGGAFVLFTSFEHLKKTYSFLKPRMEKIGLTVMRQGESGTRHQLLARFRKERNAVLFGTDSFWEGVDVKGDALRIVIIARLPFHVPSEPVQQARTERISALGGDPFRELSIPQAVLKLRQGFGRLIRSRDDHGAVLILDNRIATKNYGKRFLKSLPEAALMVAPSEKLFHRLEEFIKSVNGRETSD